MLIDTHCHILPFLDDGAANIEEAIRMAHYAVHNGIYTIVATPHHANGKYENEASKVNEAVDALNMELKSRDITLTILSGQEIRVYKELVDDLLEGKIHTLNGTQYILLELPSYSVPEYFDELLHELSVLELTPVIAHPERNAEFVKNPGRLREYIEQGALCQVTSHSLFGMFGKKVQKAALGLCKENLAHIIASDSHNTSTRPGNLAQALEYVKTRLGEDRVQYYMHNAAYLINGETIVSQLFRKNKRKWFGMWGNYPTIGKGV